MKHKLKRPKTDVHAAAVGLWIILQFIISFQAIAVPHPTIDDPLINGTMGKLVEGEHTEAGFAPRTLSGHILYEPSYWPSHCIVKFEVKGMTADWGDQDIDHAFLGIYDGRGIDEPAPYFYSFRENFFRFNLHWRTDRDVIKCVINCAEDIQERRDATLAVYDWEGGESRDWVAEPNGLGVNWDENQWYQFTISFSPEEVVAEIDGIVKWTTMIPDNHPYKPIVPRIWLGSAPRNGSKYANHLPEILYRNFSLSDADPEGASWCGSPVAADGSVDTGELLGWIYPGFAADGLGWIYSYPLQSWVWIVGCPHASGAWVYIPLW